MNLYRYYFDCNTEKIDKTLSKLEKNLSFSKILYDKEILSNEGFFYLKDNKYYKKNINYNNYVNECHIDHFKKIIEPYQPLILYRQKHKDFFYTKNEVFRIPTQHIFIIKKKITFALNKNSSTKLILEFHNDVFKDIYFVSSLESYDISFIEDISYFMNMIL